MEPVDDENRGTLCWSRNPGLDGAPRNAPRPRRGRPERSRRGSNRSVRSRVSMVVEKEAPNKEHRLTNAEVEETPNTERSGVQ